MLVNNAGVVAASPFGEVTADDFERLAVNVRGVFVATQEAVKPIIAMDRYGGADEIAGLVSYLAGSQSAYVNGPSIRIDGGASADRVRGRVKLHANWRTMSGQS